MVVFIHGLLESYNMWDIYANKLPKHIRAIAIDLPGHGSSGNIGYHHSMALMAQVLYTVLKQERIRKAMLVGHSMGGYVAIAFAQQFPDMVKGLIMFFSSAEPDMPSKKIGRNRTIKRVKQDKSNFISQAISFLFSNESRRMHQKSISTIISIADQMTIQGIKLRWVGYEIVKME